MASIYSLQAKRERLPTHALQNQAIKYRIVEKYLLQILLVFVAYVIAGKIGQATTNIRSSNLGPVWPASGIALAAILICGYRVWPGVMAGTIVVAFFGHVSYVTALWQAAGSTLAALTGAFFLHRIANFDRSMPRLSDALSLIAFGGFGDAMVSASIGVFALHAAHEHPYSGVGAAWLIYWLGDATGILLVTPLALRFTDFVKLRGRDRFTEFCIVVLLLSATCFFIFGDLPFIPVKLHFMAFAVLPFIIWAAIRLGLGVTAVSILIVATIATIETALGSGPFAKNTTFVNAVLLDVFFGVLSVTGLSLAAAVGEREHAEQERARLVRERAEAEAQLRFAGIVESSEDAIVSVTLDGVINNWNAGAQKIYGYTEAEAVGKSVTMLVPPELADEENKILETLRTGGRIEHFETIRVTKTGKKINVSLTISPIKDSSGRTVGCSGIARDITDRRLAEAALRQSEEQFRTLAEAIPQLCWMARADGYVFWYNQRWYTYTGTTPEQMEGWGWQSVHDPRMLPSVLERWRAAISTGEPSGMIFAVRGADGVFRPFLTHAVPIKDVDGRVVRWFGTDTDITELRDAQEALRASEERLRLAQRAAGIGSFEWNIRTGAESWTPELEAMYGLPPDGFGGTHSGWTNLIHGDDLAEVQRLADEALKTGRPMTGEWRVVWPDGSVHWISGRWQVLVDESGEPSRVVGVNMDVTERKRADEALANMTRTLVVAQEQERARVARELHDDINQRLAMLAIALQQVRENHADLPSEVRFRIEELRRETNTISSDVQVLSHDLHSSQLEYLGAVAGMKSWCKEFGERQGMQIDCRHDVRSTLPQDIGLCLFRVLQEALQNAAKHSGGKRIEVQLHEEAGEIHLIVSDSGKGFDIEEARKGRGLGLTSMRERVRLVNGTIAIESKPMGGTTIHARVPLIADSNSERAVG